MADSPGAAALCVRVGDLVVALPAAAVSDVVPALQLTRVPGVGGAVAGLANVRGVVLTVADAHVLLDRPPRPGDEAALVVVTHDGRRAALLVGDVLEVRTLDGAADGPPLLDLGALLAPVFGSTAPPGAPGGTT
ncbi:MAG: chemotaxis protein CheW [Gemmatimonadales bacterium]|nr:chemotaxis protein CheW [Gemmatimonadales bacterium]